MLIAFVGSEQGWVDIFWGEDKQPMSQSREISARFDANSHEDDCKIYIQYTPEIKLRAWKGVILVSHKINVTGIFTYI